MSIDIGPLAVEFATHDAAPSLMSVKTNVPSVKNSFSLSGRTRQNIFIEVSKSRVTEYIGPQCCGAINI